MWESCGRRVIPGALLACGAVLAGVGAWTLVHPSEPAVVQRLVLLPAPPARAAVRPALPHRPPHRRTTPPGSAAARPATAAVTVVALTAPVSAVRSHSKPVPHRPATPVRPAAPGKPHGQHKPHPQKGPKPPKPHKPHKPHPPKPPKPPKP